MTTALILPGVEHDKTNIVAEIDYDLPVVTEVYSAAGRCDLAVIIRVRKNDQRLRSSQIKSEKSRG